MNKDTTTEQTKDRQRRPRIEREEPVKNYFVEKEKNYFAEKDKKDREFLQPYESNGQSMREWVKSI